MEMIILISLLAFTTTFLGGFFALKYKDKLHLIAGFSAGAVIAVAFFDLLPEALGLNTNTTIVTTLVATGFISYLIFDRFFSQGNYEEHNHRGSLRAGSLSIHSLLDGIGIGLSFQVSTAVGVVVAIAVLAHDFSDGINTVSAVIKGNGTRKQAMRWLFADAVAPVLGIISTMFFSVSSEILGVILAIFCGFFLYIGASDLIPESYHSHPTKWTTIATLIGATFIYIVIQFAR